MPPRLLRVPSKGTSLDKKLQTAFKEFAQHIQKSKNGSSSITAPTSVNTIKDILNTYRKDAKLINQICVATFITELDIRGDNVFDLLDPSTTCVILDSILQTEACREAERGLHLLAASLFQSSEDSANSQDLEGRKGTIGTQCLKPLLDFFVDDKNDFAMRRWAGFLCIQLIKDCESNLETLELVSEESRRSIGRKLVEEPDEILKVVYGYLIRAIIKEGTPIETLFPTDYDKTVYVDFPLSTQGNTGWGLQFQDYIDNLYMKNQTVEPPEEIGAFFFATTVHLVPKRQLGTTHHNTNVFVDDSQITILAPSHDGQFDSILDIPLSLIKKMTFATDQTSQVESHCISLDLSKTEEEVCFLDSKRITVNIVIFSMVSNCSDRFRSMILHSKQHIEIIDGDWSGSLRMTQSHGSKKVSSTQLTGSSPELVARLDQDSTGKRMTQMQSQSQTKVSHTTFSGSEDLPESKESTTYNPARKRLGKAGSGANSNILRGLSENSDVEDPEAEEDRHGENLYGASSKNARSKVSSPDAPTIKAKPALTGGRGVKPKAKPPINLRHSTGNRAPGGKNVLVSRSTRSKQDRKAGDGDVKFGRTSKTSSQAKALAPEKKQQTSAGHGGVLQKTDTGKTANSRKSAASQPKKAVDQFTDHSITSPDANNVSTLKVKKDIKSTNKSVKPMSKAMNSQAIRLKADAPVNGEPKAKRNGLPKPAADIPNDIFDIPEDEEEPGDINKGTAKQKSKAPPQATKAKRAAAAAKIDAKKRQSAPAALQRTAPQTRHSQRVTASKTNDNMRGTDESHEEDEVEVEEPRKTTVKSRSKATQNNGSNTQQDTTKLSKSKKTVKPELLSTADDEDIFRLQAQDARSLSLAHNDPLDIDQDLYDATPQKPPNSIAAKKVIPKKASLFSNIGHKKARSSGLDLADKLGNSLGCLDIELDESEPKETTSHKLITVEEDLVRSRPKRINKDQEGEHPATTTVHGKNKTTHHSRDEDIPSQASPQEPSIDSSRTELEAPAVSLAPPVMPTSHTRASLVHEHRKAELRKAELLDESVPASETAARLDQVSAGNPKPVPESTFEGLSSSIGKIAPSLEIETVAQHKEDLDALNQEPVLDGQSKKRKATQVDLIPSKRYRLDKSNVEKIPEPVREPIQNEVSATLPKDLGKLKAISPMHKSPRLVARVNEISDTMNNVGSDKPLIDEFNRKPQVIAFGVKGPRNQGVTGAKNTRDTRKSAANNEDTNPGSDHFIERKRKRENASLPRTISPPNKKQNSSPTESNVGDDLDNVNHLAFESSPPPLEQKSKPIRQRVLSQPSSQASRVDFNGSPIAADSPVDHMGRLKARLADPRAEKELPGEATASPRVRRAPEIFGPKISLGIKSKAQPSSPEEPNSRYIPHERTNHGSYNEVNSKQVVEPKKNLVDPFIERTRKSNDFTERLQSSASKENVLIHNATRSRKVSQEAPSIQARGADARRHHTEQQLPKLPRDTFKAKPRETHAAHRSEKKHYVSEKPIVGAKSRQIYDDSIPSDMTSGSSNASRSSDFARTPLQEMGAPNEMYNIALRPHYHTFNQAIHRIADEVIIRLSGQEEKMELLVEQYKDNGTKILNSLVEKREDGRATISEKLDKKKSEIASAYSEARSVVMETAESLRENPTNHFEKEWRKSQEGIRKQIAEGRKSSAT